VAFSIEAKVIVCFSPTISIATAFADDVRVREKDVQATVARSNSKYALPSHQVDLMIEERRIRLLDSAQRPKGRDEEVEIEKDRWQ